MALLIHDPRYDEKPSQRPIFTESYWQRGCDDAKAGRPRVLPSNGGRYEQKNAGYLNGYRYGSAARQPQVDGADGVRPLAKPLTDVECWEQGKPDSIDRAMAADAPQVSGNAQPDAPESAGQVDGNGGEA